MYSYIKNDEKGGKTAKGIKKNVIKNYIKHEDYKNVSLNEKQLHHKMKAKDINLEALKYIKYHSAVLMISATSTKME